MHNINAPIMQALIFAYNFVLVIKLNTWVVYHTTSINHIYKFVSNKQQPEAVYVNQCFCL